MRPGLLSSKESQSQGSSRSEGKVPCRWGHITILGILPSSNLTLPFCSHAKANPCRDGIEWVYNLFLNASRAMVYSPDINERLAAIKNEFFPTYRSKKKPKLRRIPRCLKQSKRSGWNTWNLWLNFVRATHEKDVGKEEFLTTPGSAKITIGITGRQLFQELRSTWNRQQSYRSISCWTNVWR